MRKDLIVVKHKDNPVLLDRVLQDLQMTMEAKLSWLDHAFGRSYRMVSHTQDGDKLVYPAVYFGEGEYVSVLPNDRLGNFSWFDIYDPQEITDNIQSRPQFTFSGAVVFWFNLSSIYEDSSMLYTEEVKEEIVRLLTTPGNIKSNSKLTIDRIYEKPENIYKGYTLEKIYDDGPLRDEGLRSVDKQFFMYPYAGLRIEFTIKTRELC